VVPTGQPQELRDAPGAASVAVEVGRHRRDHVDAGDGEQQRERAGVIRITGEVRVEMDADRRSLAPTVLDAQSLRYSAG